MNEEIGHGEANNDKEQGCRENKMQPVALIPASEGPRQMDRTGDHHAEGNKPELEKSRIVWFL